MPTKAQESSDSSAFTHTSSLRHRRTSSHSPKLTMAVEWTKLMETCNRKIRYVTNNFVKKMDETLQENRYYIEKCLELFSKHEQNFQCILETMENSNDPDRSTDTIDDFKAQFDQINIQFTSKLMDAITEKTQRPEKSEQGDDNGYHISQSISASTQLKLCNNPIADINAKLESSERFNEHIDPSESESTTILNFYDTKIVRLQPKSGDIHALISSMLILEQEINQINTVQVNTIDSSMSFYACKIVNRLRSQLKGSSHLKFMSTLSRARFNNRSMTIHPIGIGHAAAKARRKSLSKTTTIHLMLITFRAENDTSQDGRKILSQLSEMTVNIKIQINSHSSCFHPFFEHLS